MPFGDFQSQPSQIQPTQYQGEYNSPWMPTNPTPTQNPTQQPENTMTTGMEHIYPGWGEGSGDIGLQMGGGGLMEMLRKKKLMEQQQQNIFSQGGQQPQHSQLNQGGQPQTITNEGMGQQMQQGQSQYQTPWSQNYSDPWAQSAGADYQGGGMMATRNKRDFEGVGMESMQSPYTASGYY